MSEDLTVEYARNEAEAIRRLLGKTAECLVEVGRRLIEVKARLKHGEWGDYLRREFDWNERTAQRFMTVADRFKNDNLSDLNIAPSALYLLSAGSTPDQARDAILERARAGEHITHGIARAAIEATRPRTLIIDPEFSNLLPKHDEEVLAGIEDSILRNGVYLRLVTWRGILLDGHARYAICHKHGILFDIDEREFDNREAAKVWILRNQLNRHNATPEQLSYYRGKLYEMEKRKRGVVV